MESIRKSLSFLTSEEQEGFTKSLCKGKGDRQSDRSPFLMKEAKLFFQPDKLLLTPLYIVESDVNSN